MKNLLNRKFVASLALAATFLLPVIAFAADGEPVTPMDGVTRWVLLCMFGLIAFVAMVGVLIGIGSGVAGILLSDDGEGEE